MQSRRGIRKKAQKILLIFGLVGIAIVIALGVIINLKVEPALRNKLHTLIIQGSDSLYTYKLGSLKANIFGGNIEVNDLQVSVDSARYKILEQRKILPALTIQVNMRKGSLKGVGVFALMFGKKINISKIASQDADVRLSRHLTIRASAETTAQPLWKAIQPAIKSISIGEIKVEGIRLFYEDVEKDESTVFQFDRCDALLEDIKVDREAASDTSRIGFMKELTFLFQELQLQSADSTYKLKVRRIGYSSQKKLIEIDTFALAPTLPVDDLIKRDSIRRTYYNTVFEHVKLHNVRIDRFIQTNRIEADSIVFSNTRLSLFLDKSLPINYESKIGKYPHQNLLNTKTLINIKKFITHNLSLDYTERNEKTGESGTFRLDNFNVAVSNITNDSQLIRLNNICSATASGIILESSPITTSFKFYLDSSNGRFDVDGTIQNISAQQINKISVPLANVEVRSAQIKSVKFHVEGEDYTASADVQMQYNNMSLIFRKIDEQTGQNKTQGFLTKMLNRYVIHPNNPGPGGVERTANNAMVARLTTQSFFGLIWKAIFAGMQDILMKAGKID